jgi:uncharacterized tellurite resistance protein B-like protein
MPQQDLYIGLGNVAYALSQMDGRLQAEEAAVLQQLLREEPHGDIAFNAFHLNQQYGVKAEEAYQFAFRRFAENRRELDAGLKKKFIDILQRVADSAEGTSRKEQELLRRCRKEINRL